MEPISPELVLIDPELGRAERARLDERARLASIVDISTLRRVVEAANPAPTPQPTRVRLRAATESARTRALPTLLAISLLANGILAATRSHGRNERQSASVSPSRPVRDVRSSSSAHVVMATSRTRTRAVPAPTVAQPPTAPVAATTTNPQLTPRTDPALEREILALVVESPRNRLLRRLIDQRTGLAKNNLQAVCVQEALGSFLCVVRPLHHKPGEGLYVRFHRGPDGRGVFTWSRYREP